MLESLLTTRRYYEQSLESLSAEVKALSEKANAIKASISSIDEEIDNTMQLHGAEKSALKVADGKFDISYRKSSRTVVIDESLLPETVFEVKKSVSLTKVKAAIEGGEIDASAAKIEQVQNLQIKFTPNEA